MILQKLLRAGRWAVLFWTLLPLALLATPIWDWPVPDWRNLIAHVLAWAGAFHVGALLAAMAMRRAGPRLDAELAAAFRAPTRHDWSIVIALVAVIALNALTALSRSAAFSVGSCGGGFLECSNAAYAAFVEGQQSGAAAAMEYARIVLSPVMQGGIAFAAWGLVVHPRGGPRLLYAGVLLTEILVSVITGTSRNFANLILLGIALFGIRRALIPHLARIRLGVIIVILAASLGFFAYFSAIQIGREGLVAAVGLQPFSDGYIEALSSRSGSDNFLLKGIESVVRYLSGGYFSLSLGLDLKFGETFPFGHSLVLSRRAELTTGSDHWIAMSIPGQIESAYGWERNRQWHSIYSWLLSDFGRMGTAAIMAMLGAVFSFALALAVTKSDLLSKLPFFLMFILVLYIPANNQLTQMMETTTAFIFSIGLLLVRLPGLVTGTPPVPARLLPQSP